MPDLESFQINSLQSATPVDTHHHNAGWQSLACNRCKLPVCPGAPGSHRSGLCSIRVVSVNPANKENKGDGGINASPFIIFTLYSINPSVPFHYRPSNPAAGTPPPFAVLLIFINYMAGKKD
jgi:hypothetical protein